MTLPLRVTSSPLMMWQSAPRGTSKRLKSWRSIGPISLGNLADLGLSLAEAKQLLARLRIGTTSAEIKVTVRSWPQSQHAN